MISVYIVEDDFAISRIYKLRLSNAEMNVEIFSSAELLFERLEHQTCDVILMDLMLPGA